MRHLKQMMITACLTMSAGSALAAPQVPEARFEAVGQGRMLRAQKPIQGEYLVVFKTKPLPGRKTVSATTEARVRGLGVEILHTYQHAFGGFLIRASEEQARMLADHPEVDYVQENGLLEPAGVQINPPWHLDRIDQPNLPSTTSTTRTMRPASTSTSWTRASGRRSPRTCRGRWPPGASRGPAPP